MARKVETEGKLSLYAVLVHGKRKGWSRKLPSC